ncbi:hypothetical protein IWX63_002895 [Arthrobacter sp. CAN_A2]|uniref:hypothetical protein n=1 Tax=Arthrobacter sp. CAN_A2 TaxID=2787718 RepID=UPI0018EFEAF7
MSAEPDSPAATAALTAWTSALDALEDVLDTLEAAAATIPDEETAADPELLRRAAAAVDWTPPRVDAPIPAVLVPRAARISERQQAVLTRLTADADTLRRHRSALGSVQAATAPRQSSVYLDVTG